MRPLTASTPTASTASPENAGIASARRRASWVELTAPVRQKMVANPSSPPAQVAIATR